MKRRLRRSTPGSWRTVTASSSRRQGLSERAELYCRDGSIIAGTFRSSNGTSDITFRAVGAGYGRAERLSRSRLAAVNSRLVVKYPVQRLLHRFKALAVVGAGFLDPAKTMSQVDAGVVHKAMQGREHQIHHSLG